MPPPLSKGEAMVVLVVRLVPAEEAEGTVKGTVGAMVAAAPLVEAMEVGAVGGVMAERE